MKRVTIVSLVASASAALVFGTISATSGSSTMEDLAAEGCWVTRTPEFVADEAVPLVDPTGFDPTAIASSAAEAIAAGLVDAQAFAADPAMNALGLSDARIALYNGAQPHSTDGLHRAEWRWTTADGLRGKLHLELLGPNLGWQVVEESVLLPDEACGPTAAPDGGA